MSASGVLALFKSSTYPYGKEPVLAGAGRAGTKERFASSFAAALLDGLFAHPADYSDTETAHELIIAYTQ